MAALPSRRVNAPVRRFSSMVRWPKQWRPSKTWMQPRRTSSVGERSIDALAVERDRALCDLAALGAQQVRDSLESGRLAGPVRPKDRHDAAARDGERDALQHEDDVVVDHLDVVDGEDRRGRVGSGGGLRLKSCGHGRVPISSSRVGGEGLAPEARGERSEGEGAFQDRAHPETPPHRTADAVSASPRTAGRGDDHDGLSQTSVRFGQPVFFSA